MKYYLAGPWFSDYEKEVYNKVIKELREYFLTEDEELFIPAEHEVKDAWTLPNLEWGKEVYNIDLEGLDAADVVIVLDHGFTSDCGTAWEMGYAKAKGKYIIHILCQEDSQSPYSLMLANSADETYKVSDLAFCTYNKVKLSLFNYKNSVEVK